MRPCAALADLNALLLAGLLAASSAGPLHASSLPSDPISTLSRAAADPGLEPWQREFFRRRLADLTAAAASRAGLAGADSLADSAATAPVWEPVATTPRRQGHTAIVDSLTRRVILFGGSVGTTFSNEVQVADLGTGAGWSRLATTGPAPTARIAHLAVLDAARRRMLVFGGTDLDGAYLDDLWALDLDGPPAWTLLTPGGSAPTARANAAGVVDAPRRRLLLYGGTDGSFAPPADLFSFSLDDPGTWTPIVPAGAAPAGFTAASALLDGVRNRVLLCGIAMTGYSPYVQFYSLDLAAPTPAWVGITPASAYMLSVYGELHFFIDEPGDRLVGCSNDYALNVASLPLANLTAPWTAWTSVGPKPYARPGAAWVADRAGRRMLYSGGAAPSSIRRAVSDLWALDLGTLTTWNALLVEPVPRASEAIAFDAAQRRAYLYGGVADSGLGGYGTTPTNALVALDCSAAPGWTGAATSGGPMLPRAAASMIVDPVRRRLVVFGGANGNLSTNEVWTRPLDAGTAWQRVVIPGTLPRQRNSAAAVYDPLGDRMLVFGGNDNGVVLGDLWALSLAGPPGSMTWTRLEPAGPAPAERYGSALVFEPLRNAAFLVGGANANYSSSVRAGETWKLALTGPLRWGLVCSGLPGATSYPGDEITRGVFVDPASGDLVRGTYLYSFSGSTPAITRLSPDRDTLWTAVPTRGVAPATGQDAVATFDPAGRRMLWFSGLQGAVDGVWSLTLPPVALAVPPTDSPAPGPLRVAPNPARAAVTVRFELVRAGRVHLELLDLAGRRVRGPVAGAFQAGTRELGFDDLQGLPAGVYFARLGGAVSRQARVAIVR